MQLPKPSPSSPAGRASTLPDSVNRVSPRTASPPPKRRRTSASPPASPSASPSRSPSLEPQPPPVPAPATAKWFRKPSVVWYRGNDLRVEDHPALLAASQRGGPVVPLFVWDPCDGFGTDLGNVKRWWLRESLRSLQRDLRRLGVQLYTRTGPSTEELRKFLQDTGADAVFWNRCYEPDLLSRDEELIGELTSEGLTAESFKAELLVEPWELTNTSISPCFGTFHAYMRAWMTGPPPPQPFPCPSCLQPIKETVKSVGIEALRFDIPDKINEGMSRLWVPGSAQAKVQLDKFLHEVFPAFGEDRCRRHFDGTSRLSPHIRFGELSPRRMYHSTRLRVSRWDEDSMRVIGPSPKKRSSVQANGGVVTTRGKMLATSRETPENGTTVKRKGEGHVANTHSPPAGDTLVAASLDGYPSEDGNQKAVITDNDVQRAQPGKRYSTTLRKTTLPRISVSARAFLKNLCLRDFSYHVLYHNPDFNTKPLIPEFVNFPWAEDAGYFESWKTARTGYPIIDAAMRELRETGWIHNGMRFLLACFLTKYLLLPWSRGLKEFYGLLLDGDHSSNAMGWQWTAGSNTDAFPVRFLVSPVKVANRHDPTGTYVRRWVPELAKLPSKFIHEPWKAPPDLLKSIGLELGKSYPKRVVLMAEARNRVLDAMRLMKQIFSGSSVLRGICETMDDEVVEWPEEQHEILQVDESVPLTGKMGLLPSLWALLQGDQQSNYPSNSSSGSDPLIAMDTASLAEGALAVPLDDQHESIEHALITAHAQVSSSEVLSMGAEAVGEGDLGEQTYTEGKNCETQAMIGGASAANNLLVDDNGEPLKYHAADVGAFTEPEKVAVQAPSHHPDETRFRGNSMRNLQPQTTHSSPLHANLSALQASSTQNFGPGSHMSYAQQPQQQIQQFQQLQQLQHQLQPFHFQQQRQQPLHQQHPLHQQRHPPPASHLQQPHTHTSQQRQQQQRHHQHQQQQQQPHIHSMVDGLYGHGPSNGTASGNSIAGVPMPGASVMLGPATGNQETGVNSMFPGQEPGNSVYAQQFGMGPFYGFPQVMPVVNPHAMNGGDRNATVGSATAVNSQKLAVPGMLRMPYGGYISGVVDQNALGNTFTSNGLPYNTSAPASTQPPTPGGPPHYGLPPHPMYYAQNPSDLSFMQGTGHMAQQPSSQMIPTSHIRQAEMMTTPQARNVTAAAAAVEAGGREVASNIPHDAQTHPPANAMRVTEGLRVDGQTPLPPSRQSGNLVSAQGFNNASAPAKPAHGRSGTKSNARSKGPTRRKGPGSGAVIKNRSESRGASGGRGRGGTEVRSPTSAQNGVGENVQSHGTTLKARQEILESVLGRDDHEYHNFAKYLAITYELTGNTDRHSSKDYIRLCTLKDEYHKQCELDRDKLKIYGIKTFFSKILKLEVTGEWDRHNHGGVRGPYVYGIRLRRSADAAQHVTQN